MVKRVAYDSIDSIVALVKSFGKGALMAKTDIKDTFRLLPFHPDDYNLLGFSLEIDGKTIYFYDKCSRLG